MDLKKASEWTVCLVEDEPDNMTLISESLEFFGVKVITARDGVEGLALLETATPTLILMDLSMPHMDGWEMLRRLREHPTQQDIPVIALTAHAMSTDREKVKQAGFDGYMTKPVNIPTLLNDIEEAIAARGEKAKSQVAAEPKVEVKSDLPTTETTESVVVESKTELPTTEAPIIALDFERKAEVATSESTTIPAETIENTPAKNDKADNNEPV